MMYSKNIYYGFLKYLKTHDSKKKKKKIWAGFKETTREYVNHMTSNSREQSPPLGLMGQFLEPEKGVPDRSYGP